MATLHELSEHFLLGRIAAAFALVPLGLVVTPAHRTAALAVIGTALTIYFDTEHAPGLIVAAVIVYCVAWGLARVRNERLRWRAAVALIGATTVAYIAELALRLDGWYASIGRAHVFFVGLDMFLVLRAITLFWEVGSGEIALPGPAEFVGWIALPFTMVGPILRAKEYRASLERAAKPKLDAAWLRRVVVACAMVAGAVAMGLWSILLIDSRAGCARGCSW